MCHQRKLWHKSFLPCLWILPTFCHLSPTFCHLSPTFCHLSRGQKTRKAFIHAGLRAVDNPPTKGITKGFTKKARARAEAVENRNLKTKPPQKRLEFLGGTFGVRCSDLAGELRSPPVLPRLRLGREVAPPLGAAPPTACGGGSPPPCQQRKNQRLRPSSRL